MKSSGLPLLPIFVGVCAVCALLVGFKALGSAHRHVQTRLTELREQSAAHTRWLEEKELWESRAAWMAKNPAPSQDTESAASALLTSMQSSLNAAGIKIFEQGFSPSTRAGRYNAVGVRLKVGASFDTFAKWLIGLQQAPAYLGVEKITIKADGAPPQVVCDFEVKQYLLPTTP